MSVGIVSKASPTPDVAEVAGVAGVAGAVEGNPMDEVVADGEEDMQSEGGDN